MKLVTFLKADAEKIGAVMADGRILDFAAAEPRLGGRAPAGNGRKERQGKRREIFSRHDTVPPA